MTKLGELTQNQGFLLLNPLQSSFGVPLMYDGVTDDGRIRVCFYGGHQDNWYPFSADEAVKAIDVKYNPATRTYEEVT